jgi:hypothetical protein
LKIQGKKGGESVVYGEYRHGQSRNRYNHRDKGIGHAYTEGGSRNQRRGYEEKDGDGFFPVLEKLVNKTVGGQDGEVHKGKHGDKLPHVAEADTTNPGRTTLPPGNSKCKKSAEK